MTITQELLIIAVLVAATVVTAQGLESGTIDLSQLRHIVPARS